jgi:hypothetical protein
MAEISILNEAARLIQGFGVVGVIFVFVGLEVYLDRQRTKRDNLDREERAKSVAESQLLLTNHLSGILKEEVESRENSAIAMTKLSDSINNFQKNCLEIQSNLRNEVERIKRENDGR